MISNAWRNCTLKLRVSLKGPDGCAKGGRDGGGGGVLGAVGGVRDRRNQLLNVINVSI